MPINPESVKRYKRNNVFVETGSHRGDGINMALDANYDKVLSIECHQGYYSHCQEMFKDNERVSLFFGDSSKDLFDMIKDYNEPMTFWLDAHYMYDDPNQLLSEHPGLGYVPLIDELTHISKHPVKTHLIFIDDINHLSNLAPRGEDPPTGTVETQLDNLIAFIKEKINNDYEFHQIDNNVLVCEVKT